MEFFGLFHLKMFLGLFDECYDIAHAEDSAGHTFGVELFELVELFTDADELDGLRGDGLYAECGPAAGVAVKFCEDDTIKLKALVEFFC